MKRLLLFFAVLIGFSSVASAQIGYNDVQFYVRAGYSIKDVRYIDAWVNIDGRLYNLSVNTYDIKQMLKKDPNFLNSPQKVIDATTGYGWGCYFPDRAFKRDYNLSTSSKIVYTVREPAGSNALGQSWESAVFHAAFSKDGSTLIAWREGNSESRKTYVRVDKDEFKPKADNLDFLYE